MHMDGPAALTDPVPMCRCGRGSHASSSSSTAAAAQAATQAPAPSYHLKTRIYYDSTETPVNGARWEILGDDGLVARSGTTGEDGFVIEDLPRGGRYQLRVVEIPPEPGSET